MAFEAFKEPWDAQMTVKDIDARSSARRRSMTTKIALGSACGVSGAEPQRHFIRSRCVRRARRFETGLFARQIRSSRYGHDHRFQKMSEISAAESQERMAEHRHSVGSPFGTMMRHTMPCLPGHMAKYEPRPDDLALVRIKASTYGYSMTRPC